MSKDCCYSVSFRMCSMTRADRRLVQELLHLQSRTGCRSDETAAAACLPLELSETWISTKSWNGNFCLISSARLNEHCSWIDASRFPILQHALFPVSIYYLRQLLSVSGVQDYLDQPYFYTVLSPCLQFLVPNIYLHAPKALWVYFQRCALKLWRLLNI